MKKETERALTAALDKHQRTVANALTREAVRAHISGDLTAYKAMQPIGIRFDLVQAEALAYSKEYGALLKREGASIIQGKKVPWLKDSTGRTRAEVFKTINEGLKEGKPVDKIGRELRKTLIRDKKFEFERIARTEVARIQSAGSLARYEANGVKKFKWLCGGDPCPLCSPYCGKIFSIDEIPEIPVHPNCTCDKAPIITREVRKEIEKKASVPETIKEKTKTIKTDQEGITKNLGPHRVDNLKLTQAELNATYEYKGVGYIRINNGLRGKEKLTAEYKNHIKKLDSSLSKSKVPDDINTFRGISPKQAKALKDTNVCYNKGYTSTTYNPENAFTFAERADDGYFNIMEMKVKKDTKALMWPGGENEIMLERGLNLKCTSIREVSNFATKSGKAAAIKTKKVRIFVMEAV